MIIATNGFYYYVMNSFHFTYIFEGNPDHGANVTVAKYRIKKSYHGKTPVSNDDHKTCHCGDLYVRHSSISGCFSA